MMKKFFKQSMVLLLSLLLMVSFAGTAMADDGISVTVNGSKVAFDVQPQVINNRVMVPMRAIFEALDASVEYDSTTKTINAYKGNQKISLVMNSDKLYVSGYDPITLDAPAQSIDGRTMVPLRAISEAFKTTVNWDQVTKSVTISKNDSTASSNANSNNASNSNDSVSSKEFTWSDVNNLLSYGKQVMSTSGKSMEYCNKALSASKLTQVTYMQFAVDNGNLARTALGKMIAILEQKEDLICDDGNTVLSAAQSAYDVLGELNDVKISTSNIISAMTQIARILSDSGKNILRVENVIIDLAEEFA